MGRHFERLIVYWVSVIRCEVLAESQQIVLNGRTVGEIICFSNEQSPDALEIAVKFYLQLQGRLRKFSIHRAECQGLTSKKASRLLDHQLPLSAQFYPEVERRQGLVKGRIFYHWQRGEREIHSRELNEHLSGRWLRFGEHRFPIAK